MTRFLYLLAAVLVLWVQPAFANTFSFGSTSLFSSTQNELNGGAADRQTAQSSTGGGASANFRAQSSADQTVGAADAIADFTYTWDAPYTITRTVAVVPGNPVQLNVPLQQVAFTISFSGAVAIDDNTGPTEGAQLSFPGVTVQSLGGLISTLTYTGATRVDNTGGDESGTTAINQGPTGRTWNTAAGSSVGEVTVFANIPTTYNVWTDFNSPFATDFSGSTSYIQSFTDTLRVSFRVRAQSLSGSLTNGGEAIACGGLSSTMGAFGINPNCGTGLTIDGAISQVGNSLVTVPEPGTLLLLGSALAGLAAVVRTRRAR